MTPVSTISGEVRERVAALEAKRERGDDEERTCRAERLAVERALDERLRETEQQMAAYGGKLAVLAGIGAAIGGAILQLCIYLITHTHMADVVTTAAGKQ